MDLVLRNKIERLALAAACIAIGAALGLSYADSASNHPTYVPQGLMKFDPSFLKTDWWAQTTIHYHHAFSFLVYALASVHAVPWGLAFGNVACIAVTFFTLWRIVRDEAEAAPAIFIWSIAVYFFFVMKGVQSVASSNLFTQGMQPSSIGTVATVLTVYLAVKRRWVPAGLVMAVGGGFHANYLILNLALFGFVMLIVPAWERRWNAKDAKTAALDAATLLAPSLIMIAAYLPTMFSVAAQGVSEPDLRLADFIFFDFALPFHYKPLTFLNAFWTLAGWQVMGLLWTNAAIADPAKRRIWFALQIGIILLIWSATALTTIIFIDTVTRLFVWRLAPLAVLLAITLFAMGTVKTLLAPESPRPTQRQWALNGVALLVMTIGIANGRGIFSTQAVLELILPAALVATVAAQRYLKLRPRRRNITFALIFSGAALCVAGASQVAESYRYNLVYPGPGLEDEEKLYDWVRRNTPANAQFLIPPNDLIAFRLKTGRAIVVDLKAIPLDPRGLISWYRRLEAISATKHPGQTGELTAGYRRMTTTRLDELHEEFAIDYAIVFRDMVLTSANWSEVFRNRYFIVLERRQNGLARN